MYEAPGEDADVAHGSPTPRTIMIKSLSTPASLLALVLAIAAAMAGAMIFIAHNQPYLGLRLAFDETAGGAVVARSEGPGAGIPQGAVLTAVRGGDIALSFQASDFTIEPDGAFGPYDDYRAFLARQDQLAQAMRQPFLTFNARDGAAYQVTPTAVRPLGSLPADFWIQVLVGVVAFLISASVWTFRRSETSARYLLLSGIATLMFAPFAAVYTTRELALPSQVFLPLDDLNFLGGSLFAASLASLLLYYPHKLAPRWVGIATVTAFIAWWIAQDLGVLDNMALARRILVLAALLATFVLAGVHWWLTRRDPVARTALKWFLLSWLLGTTLFGVGILLPQLFGIDTSGYQGYAFTLFLLVYGGLAFGILRFRLFDLGDWWARIVLWTLSIVILAAFDILFLFGLHQSAEASLSFALLACGLIWLPARGWLMSRLFSRSRDAAQALLPQVVAVGLDRHGPHREEAWIDLLKRLFAPLQINPAKHISEPRFEDDGLTLTVPSIDSLPGLRLGYANGGRRLFGRADVATAGELIGMLRLVIQSREAYDKGVAVERKRIADDIHDNIGGPLVSALHVPSAERKDALIRETLNDLRSIINDASAGAAEIGEALAEIRYETSDRLTAAGVQLDWPVEPAGGFQVASADVHLLRSVLREAVSNIIKHADARHVSVSIEASATNLRLAVEDDGRGFDPDALAPGRGLPTIQGRLIARGGSAVWRKREKGMRLALELPLEISAAPSRPPEA